MYHHNLIAYDLLYLMTDYYLENGKPLYGIIHKDVELANPGVCKVIKELSLSLGRTGEVLSPINGLIRVG